ncbi:hypothetical protein E5Q_00337, partial [Mixia osmundae IAM 14324]
MLTRNGLCRVCQEARSLQRTAEPARRTISTSARSTAAQKAQGSQKGKSVGFKGGAKGSAPAREGGAASGGSRFLLDQSLVKPAVTLSHLPFLSASNATETAIGRPHRFPAEATSLFGSFGIPASLADHFQYTTEPASVLRASTVNLHTRLDNAAGQSSAKHRVILVGDSGSGKSMTMLQIMTLLKPTWAILYIPNAVKLVDASSPYTYSREAKMFVQPTLSASILRSFASVNESLLTGTPDGKQLLSIAKQGADKGGQAAVDALDRVFAAVTKQSSVPILIAVDSVQALFRTSAYKDTTNKPLEAYALSIPRLLLELFAGQRSIVNGALLGAISTLETPWQSPALPASLGLVKAHPYADLGDPLYSAFAKTIEPVAVPAHMPAREAEGLSSLLRDSQHIHGSLSNRLYVQTMLS